MTRIRPNANIVAMLIDGITAICSFVLALYLRLGEDIMRFSENYMLFASGSFGALLLAVMLINRTYRQVWRYTSMNDLINLLKVASVSVLVFYVALFEITRLELFPRSVIFIHWICVLGMLCANRLVARLYHDRTILSKRFTPVPNRVSVALIGANADAEMFIRESQRNGLFPYEVVALIDESATAQGREIHHIRIYGPLSRAKQIIAKLRRKNIHPQRFIICDHQLSPDVLSELIKVCRDHSITLSRLPRLSELHDQSERLEVKPIAIEDILGRPQVALDHDAMRGLIQNKTVLVTGAGGSIGSELTRQIASFGPKTIVLFEISEFQLYQIGYELTEDFPGLNIVSIVGDVRNADQLDRAFQTHHPEIVFHAAAIKQVPLAEINVDQAVLTNVLGSKQVLDCCINHKIGTLVQISTDKAVNPTSIMGATKRIAEIYAQTRAQQMPCPTHVITVRFGNVLGSNGSVVPLFQRQITKGGPVTVTHPEMTRYLMTIDEAVQLVLQTAALGLNDSERAPIFVLEMGSPVKILELAKQMIFLAGLVPEKDIKITFTGIRPGEKLYEGLFHDQENLLKTSHRSIHKARARRFDIEQTITQIDRIIQQAKTADEATIRSIVRELVPEYTPFQQQAEQPVSAQHAATENVA